MNTFTLKYNADTGTTGASTPPPETANTTSTATTQGAAGTTTTAAASTTATPSSTAQTSSSEAGKSAASWVDSLAQDSKDYVLNKGFKDPAMVVDSYKNLEKLLGAPKEKLLRMPDAADAPEWAGIYEKLGKPADPNGYKLEASEGGMPKEMLEQVKGLFHQANLTVSQAEAVVKGWNEINGKAAQTTQAEAQAKFSQEEGGLKTEWGNAFEQNSNIAKSAAKEFGVDTKTITAMEKDIGYKATMKFFHSLGSKIGEGQFTVGEGKSMGFGRMSPDAAKAQITAYKQDSAFMTKYMNGDVAAKKLMNQAMGDAYPGEMTI